MLSVFMVLACLLLVAVGGKWLLAEYYFEKAKARVEEWERLDSVYPLEDWERAAGNIEKAVSLNSARADFHLYRAFVFEWGLRAPFPNDQVLSPGEQVNRIIERVEGFRMVSLQAYRDSLSVRPASAQSWIGLTDTKGQLGEFDDEFVRAYAMANQYGKNLPYYNNSLSFLAARYFDELQSMKTSRPVHLGYFRETLTGNQALNLLNQLNRFQVLILGCRLFIDEGMTMTDSARSRCEAQSRAE